MPFFIFASNVCEELLETVFLFLFLLFSLCKSQTKELQLIHPDGKVAKRLLDYASYEITISDCLSEGQWWNQNSCEGCPNGGFCPGGDRVYPLVGYWSDDRRIRPLECAVFEVQNIKKTKKKFFFNPFLSSSPIAPTTKDFLFSLFKGMSWRRGRESCSIWTRYRALRDHQSVQWKSRVYWPDL